MSCFIANMIMKIMDANVPKVKVRHSNSVITFIMILSNWSLADPNNTTSGMDESNRIQLIMKFSPFNISIVFSLFVVYNVLNLIYYYIRKT